MFRSWMQLRALSRYLREECADFDNGKGSVLDRTLRVLIGREEAVRRKHNEIILLRQKYEPSKSQIKRVETLRGGSTVVSTAIPERKTVSVPGTEFDEVIGRRDPGFPPWYPSAERTSPPPFRSGRGGDYAGAGAEGSWDTVKAAPSPAPAPAMSPGMAAGMGFVGGVAAASMAHAVAGETLTENAAERRRDTIDQGVYVSDPPAPAPSPASEPETCSRSDYSSSSSDSGSSYSSSDSSSSSSSDSSSSSSSSD